MTTTNRLFYTVSKRYIQAGTTFKIDVKILLADDCFNWKDYETKVTENDFNKFVSSVNRSLLPAGITFKMK